MRNAADLITIVVTLLAWGCPIVVIVRAFGFDERTVRSWQEKSGAHAQQVHEHLVEQPRDLGQVQADEICVNAQNQTFWMAMAMTVSTRLWLGGEVSARRDSALIESLIARVKRCASALCGMILFCIDGLASYPTAIRKVFREKEPRTEKGRCRMIGWPNLLIAHVVKQYEGRRVSGVDRRIEQGTAEEVAAVIAKTQGGGGINTSYIERLNGTFRSCLNCLARRTRSLVRQSRTLHTGMYLVGTIYNFCTEHESLRLPGLIGGHKWLGRTPAMANGRDHGSLLDGGRVTPL